MTKAVRPDADSAAKCGRILQVRDVTATMGGFEEANLGARSLGLAVDKSAVGNGHSVPGHR